MDGPGVSVEAETGKSEPRKLSSKICSGRDLTMRTRLSQITNRPCRCEHNSSVRLTRISNQQAEYPESAHRCGILSA